MRRVTLLTGGLLAALVVLLAACEPGEPEVAVIDQVAAEDRAALEQPEEEGGGEQAPVPPDGETVVYEGTDTLEWAAAPGEMPAGPLAVELQCEALPHNVVYEGENNDEPVVECDGGDSQTGQQDLAAGEYTYYCSIAGHREAGMEGTVTVTG